MPADKADKLCKDYTCRGCGKPVLLCYGDINQTRHFRHKVQVWAPGWRRSPVEEHSDHAGHHHDPGELSFDEEDDDYDRHNHSPTSDNPYLVRSISFILLLIGSALDYCKAGFFSGCLCVNLLRHLLLFA